MKGVQPKACSVSRAWLLLLSLPLPLPSTSSSSPVAIAAKCSASSARPCDGDCYHSRSLCCAYAGGDSGNCDNNCCYCYCCFYRVAGHLDSCNNFMQMPTPGSHCVSSVCVAGFPEMTPGEGEHSKAKRVLSKLSGALTTLHQPEQRMAASAMSSMHRFLDRP